MKILELSLLRYWGSNAGPCACKANTLPTEPSPPPGVVTLDFVLFSFWSAVFMRFISDFLRWFHFFLVVGH